jgi:hypothetical protein
VVDGFVKFDLASEAGPFFTLKARDISNLDSLWKGPSECWHTEVTAADQRIARAPSTREESASWCTPVNYIGVQLPIQEKNRTFGQFV